MLEATARTAGGVLVGIILVHLGLRSSSARICPAISRTLQVSPQRLLVYLGLDVNGMIGAILAVAVIIVVPFTLMGQVLGRTGGSAYFADLAMSAMGRFRGGAAKIAVVGSALFGMISGAAVEQRDGGRHRHHPADAALRLHAARSPPRSRRWARPAGN